MRLLFLLLFLSIQVTIQAQGDIPLGTWRTHFSYNKTLNVVDGGERIYVSAENGIFFYDQSDNSISTISKIDGLQEDNISAINYDKNNQQLIIGYASGNVDIVADNEIVSLDLTTNSQVLGSKKINHISITNERAFISTDFGLLNVDLAKQEVTEIYRQLGASAEEIGVNASAVLADSIFLATENGVMSSNISNGVNLFDPNNWRRYDVTTGIEQVNINEIETFSSGIIAGISGQGLLSYENGSWNLLSVLTGDTFKSLNSNGIELIAVTEDDVNVLDESYTLSTINDDIISSANDAIVSDGTIWIADENNGLLTNITGTFTSLKPSGPRSNKIFNFYSSRDQVIGVSGGFDSDRLPLLNEDGYYTFSEGQWINSNAEAESFETFNDITDATSVSNRIYLSSFGQGVLEVNGDGTSTIFDESNSTLQKTDINDGTTYVSALAISSEGLWALNYGASRPLNLFSENNWQSFSLVTSDILDVVNTVQYLWMIVDPKVGGGILVFDKTSQESRFLNDQDGNGGLPSKNVNALAVDGDGLVWVGTNEGVAFFSNSNDIINGSVDAIIPIFENRLLLRDEIITSIEIDPGNRKWIGTQNGMWLFDADADRQLLNFNVNNSPLPSDSIIAIEVLGSTGEVFVGTPDGIISYRADATNSTNEHGDVKIFPNPVTSEFNGTIGISGLAFNVDVKITDASGKLIWNTKSAGGTATWDARDYNGRRAATGIYFVFSSSEDGEETFVGKIAVVN